MPGQLTDDELRAEYVGAMGADLGSLCHELQNDVRSLRHKWGEFRELFQQGTERLDLLNATASNFFSLLQTLLYEDAMMHLARLTDPPETCNRPNLTVMRLPMSVSDAGLKARVLVATKQVVNKCRFARAWRNKRLAHTDLETFRKGRASRLPSVGIKDVVEALESLRGLLRIIDEFYGQPLSLSLRDPRGAKSLVYHLEKAHRAIQTQKSSYVAATRR